VTSVTSYVGGGTPRFYLALDVQMPNIALAQLVVMTSGEEGRERVRQKIEHLLATRFPEVRGRTSTLELGPGRSAIQDPADRADYDDIAPAAERSRN
jgi:multidrug efflux pump